MRIPDVCAWRQRPMTRVGPMSRRAAIALTIGVVLAAYALANGYFVNGLDGVCGSDTSFYGEHFETSSKWRIERRTWLPGERCVAIQRDGTEIASDTYYPRGRDWVIAAVLLVLPSTILAGWRAARHRGASSTD